MNISEILRQAWEITKKYRILWVFGLLVGLGSGGNRIRINRDMLPAEWQRALTEFVDSPAFIPTVVILIIGMFALSLVLMLISSFGEAALIDAVHGLRAEIRPTWSRGLAGGRRHVRDVFLINLLIGIPAFIVIMAAVLPVFLPLVRGFGAGTYASESEFGQEVGQWLLYCTLPACCVGLPILAVLGLIGMLGTRISVIENRGPWASLVQGGQLFKSEFKHVAVFWLAMAGVGLAIGLIVAIPICLIGALIFAPLSLTTSLTELSLAWMCGGMVFLWLIGKALGSVLQVFTSTCWTLAYDELKGERAEYPLV